MLPIATPGVMAIVEDDSCIACSQFHVYQREEIAKNSSGCPTSLSSTKFIRSLIMSSQFVRTPVAGVRGTSQ